ncbi:hypothetical protein PMAYCL1PPCAC_08897, partial [Pristionchus mayeri]
SGRRCLRNKESRERQQRILGRRIDRRSFPASPAVRTVEHSASREYPSPGRGMGPHGWISEERPRWRNRRSYRRRPLLQQP